MIVAVDTRKFDEKIVFTVEILGYRHGIVRCRGDAKVEGQLCAEAEMMSKILDKPGPRS